MTKLLTWLFVAGKLGKLLTTGGTMIISMFFYSLVFGWKYAAGFVLLIFFHEMGHYIAARQRGLNVGAPTFIPFVGAWIQLKDMPHDVHTEAYIGFAGPFAGTLASIARVGWASFLSPTFTAIVGLRYANPTYKGHVHLQSIIPQSRI